MPLPMPTIHLIEGPVGAGKSTFATKLGKDIPATRLTLDDWMSNLFKPDRPEGEDIMEWYTERKQRCIEQIWKLACDIIETGSDVILELGLIQKIDRQKFYQRVQNKNLLLKVYVLDAPHGVRKERVQHRNMTQGETYSMEVPDHVFEMASYLWEPVSQQECEGIAVEFISTDINR